MNNFFTKLFLFSLIIFLLDFFWNKFIPSNYLVPHIWITLAFFVSITIVFHFLISNASKGRPQNFIRFYMGTTALRMLLCVIVILIYRFVNKPEVIPFALGFMVHYFLFTIFEVSILLKGMKK